MGTFLFTGVPNGNHSLTIAVDGYGPEVFSVRLDEDRADTIDIGSVPLSPNTNITAVVSGTVTDARTGQPVLVSGVYLNGNLVNLSTEGGNFTTGTLDVSPGLNILEFKRIGYEPYRANMWAVREHTDIDLEVFLTSVPVEVPTVVVEANYLREFNLRRQWGTGYYLTERDIEEERPILASDMLRSTPGVMVRPGIWGGNRVLPTGGRTFGVNPDGSGRGCSAMNLYIDGVYVSADSTFAPAEQLDYLVHPDNVAAMEIYPRPSQIPAQFKIRNAICGVIVVWTKR